MEFKRQQAAAMAGAKPVILQVAKEYAELTGRRYGLFDTYKLDDAELAIVVLSSTAGTARLVVDELREQGVKAGLLKLRVFRPFPHEELAAALGDRKAVAVLDRADSYSGFGGPLFTEVRAAMYDAKQRPPVVDYIYGLGGRDVNLDHIRKVYQDLAEIARTGAAVQTVNYLGVRE
jgi:pyruvate ferredoxin oxidoreductase alpha subunit